MRTTVTIDADTERIVRRRMAERGVSFTQALNDAIRDGARSRVGREAFRTRTVSMGRSTAKLDHALTAVADLEDEELLRRMRIGS